MINVSRLITSPNFQQSFTVTRQSGDWSEATGEFETTVQTISMVGVIKPLTTKELAIQPEADRASGMINVYTLQAVFPTGLTPQKRISDQVTWKGEQYRVLNMADYSDYGFYKATCVRMLGA